MSNSYYAVKEGRQPGIYRNWEDCNRNVKGFKGQRFRKFSSEKDALEYLEDIKKRERDYSKINLEDILIPNGYGDVKTVNEDEAVAFVDGSFSEKHNNYSYGVVIITNRGKFTLCGKGDQPEMIESRNAAGELIGASIAINEAIKQGAKTLYLHYDFSGIEEWTNGMWKAKSEIAKCYVEYFETTKQYINTVFVKVKAHSGIQYNEEADRLAGSVFKN
jgi:ribonuclease HI